MKKIRILLCLTIFLVIPKSWSHALWIETSTTGEIGKEQSIKIFFGEYSYGLTETVGNDAFKKVAKFTTWLTTPSGEKIELQAAPEESFYLIKYTPMEKGVYTVELDNHEIDVIDYTKYDFGIFKTHYTSMSKFVVGASTAETVLSNKQSLTIQDVSNDSDSLSLKIYFKGEVLKEAEVTVAIADNWTKTLSTDENGTVILGLPWETKYFIEVTKKEEVPGAYKNEAYEFIWHCATYMSIQ